MFLAICFIAFGLMMSFAILVQTKPFTRFERYLEIVEFTLFVIMIISGALAVSLS